MKVICLDCIVMSRKMVDYLAYILRDEKTSHLHGDLLPRHGINCVCAGMAPGLAVRLFMVACLTFVLSQQELSSVPTEE